MDELFEDLADAQDKGMLVLPRLDKERVLRATKNRDDDRDREFNYKLHPSSLSWHMCPADYIYNKVSKNQHRFAITLKGEERMALGTARHTEWQDLILTTRLLYGHPTYPDFVKAEIDRKLKDEEKRKRVKQYPEIYIYCPYWGVSGYADSVIKDYGEPWVVDFKTVNEHPISKWDAKKLDYPTIEQQTQGYIYIVIMDKYGYWDKKIAGLRLCYYNNPCFGHKDIDPRWEWAEKVNEEKYQKTVDLLDELRSQMLRYFCGMPFKCDYKHCRSKHE